MTEAEYENIKHKTMEYEYAKEIISVMERQKKYIQAGILSINCAYRNQVNLGYIEEFDERLKECICNLFDNEIQRIRDQMDKM